MIVSIIVTAHNVQNFITESLTSLATQTFTELEILAVNDGSDDETARRMQDFAARDRRVKFLSQSHQGRGAAKNLGLAAATGKYLLFLNGGDTLPPNALARLVDLLETTNADIAIGEISSRTTLQKMPKKIHLEVLDDLAAQRRLWTHPNAVRAVGILFKHKIFAAVGKFLQGMHYEDIALIYGACSFAANVAFTNEPLYYRRLIVAPDDDAADFFSPRRLEIFRAYAHATAMLLPLYPTLAPLIKQQIANSCLDAYRELRRARKIAPADFRRYRWVIFSEWDKAQQGLTFANSANKLNYLHLKFARNFHRLGG